MLPASLEAFGYDRHAANIPLGPCNCAGRSDFQVDCQLPGHWGTQNCRKMDCR